MAKVRGKMLRVPNHPAVESLMAVRSSIALDFKSKRYAGEYEIDGDLLRVFFDGRTKTSTLTSANPEFLARLLLIELVCRVPSWGE
jgi:hypothetical protein